MKILYPKAKSLAAIQIIHGMGEHSKRYLEFSKFLNENGYAVILSDHEGHGEVAYQENKLGFIEDEFEELVNRQVEITKEFKETHKETPIYILGHSMGSFVAQGHMKKIGNETQGYILMGGCGERRFYKIGEKFFSMVSKFIDKPKDFFKKIFFMEFVIKNEKGNWLTTDEKEYKKFVSDPLCNFGYHPNFYRSFLKFAGNLYKREDYEGIDRKLKILTVSGSLDPVGQFGKGVEKLHKFYRTNKFKDTTLKLFPNMKHELLNEKYKINVYNHILSWLRR